MTNATNTAAAANATYYAVCDCNGPISVLLEADTESEAVEAFASLDARGAIDSASTDLEDDLDIAGDGMDEATFAAACEAAGARPVRALEGDGTVVGAWHLWVVAGETAYEILEEGHVFATVTAASAEAALIKAAETHPRRASDYNLEPGATSTCRWYAWEDGVSVSVELPVPGVGADGMSLA